MICFNILQQTYGLKTVHYLGEPFLSIGLSDIFLPSSNLHEHGSVTLHCSCAKTNAFPIITAKQHCAQMLDADNHMMITKLGERVVQSLLKYDSSLARSHMTKSRFGYIYQEAKVVDPFKKLEMVFCVTLVILERRFVMYWFKLHSNIYSVAICVVQFSRATKGPYTKYPKS